MPTTDDRRIYYRSSSSSRARRPTSVAVAVSAQMISSINCRHPVDIAARRCRDNARHRASRGRAPCNLPRKPADIEVGRSADAGDIQMSRFRWLPAITWSNAVPPWIETSVGRSLNTTRKTANSNLGHDRCQRANNARRLSCVIWTRLT